MLKSVQKRDGRIVDFNLANITSAIAKAGHATKEFDDKDALRISKTVEKHLNEKYGDTIPSVEQIQDEVENTLMNSSYTTKILPGLILFIGMNDPRCAVQSLD